MVKENRPLEYSTEFATYIPEAEKLLGKSLRPYIYDIHMIKASTSSAAELIEGNTTELSVAAAGSYVKVDVISASTDDKSIAAGHVRKVKTWAIDRYYDYRVEEIATSGDTASSGTKYYRELNSLWGSLYGADNDAKGNIDIGQTKKTTNETFRISANSRETRGARVWLPKNWRAKILDVWVSLADQDVGMSSGVMIFPHYYDKYDCVEEDYSWEKVGIHVQNMPVHLDASVWPREYGSGNTISKLTFYTQLIKSAETLSYHIRLMLWATKGIGSSQSKYIQGDL